MINNSAIKVDAILLAAGSSSRFGSDKRCYPIDSVPMLQSTLAAIVNAVCSVTVVLKHNDVDKLSLLLGSFSTDKRIIPLFLDQPEAGIGSNLAQAVQQLPDDCDAVLVMLADMPYVQFKTVKTVVDAYENGRIIVPVFIGDDGVEQNGHPVLFAKQFFPQLVLLKGDVGARTVLQQYAKAVTFLPVSDSGILRDIDFQ